EAVAAADAVLQTVNVFVPVVRYKKVHGGLEAWVVSPPKLKKLLTEATCEAARAAEYATFGPNPAADAVKRLNQQKANCVNAGKSAGSPVAHNEIDAFLTVVIELSRVFDSPYYRSSASGGNANAANRALLALLVARGQRYFADHLTAVGSDASTG